MNPARGGEGSGVLPGAGPQATSWTRVVVQRATPFAVVAAIFAVQALADAQPVVAFPLYLAVALLVALQPNRAQSIAVAAVGALALVIRPLATGEPASSVAAGFLLAAVLVGVAIAANELMRHSRLAAASAQQRVEELAAAERRLRAAVESAEVGLGLADLDGKLTQVSDRLAAILGRGPDDLLGMSLVELAAENDRPAVADAIELLRNGDVTRWEGEISDLPEVPVRLFLARVPNTATGEPVLLVQGSDIAARRRVEALRDCTAAVREVLVTSAGADQAMPLVLRAFCERLGWSAAQHWVVDEERKSMRVRHSWNASGAALEGFLHASRGVVAAEGSGLRGRVWQAGVLIAEEDLEQSADYQPAALSAGLRSALAFPILEGGDVIGVIELVSQAARSPEEAMV